MKRLIQITLSAFLVIGLCSTSFAQTGSDNASTAANATVEAPITVSGDQTIEYGTLTTGTDDGTNSPTQAGYFTVDASATASVDLSFSKTDLTTGSTGSDQTIVMNLASAGTEDGAWEDGASSDFATASSSGTAFFLADGTDAIMPSDGTITVWANPTVTLDGTEVPGSYSGSVTLTATYN